MKHLLVVDVELNEENKHICKDDNNRCPLWNEEVNLCMYNFSNNTKGCPLKPLPQKKVLDEELFKTGNFRLVFASYTGWNECIDEILGDDYEQCN